MTTSGFHGDVKVSCLTVGTHLKQLQRGITGNLFILYPNSDNDNDDYQELLRFLVFSAVDGAEKLAVADWVTSHV